MDKMNDTSTRTSPVKGRVARALRRSRERFVDVAESMELSLAEAAKRADEAAYSSVASLTDLIHSTIDGAVKAGSKLADVTKGVSLGVLRGARRKGGPALEGISHAARTILGHTAARGGDLADAARGIVRGSIQFAKEWGLNAAETASVAARSVLDATQDLGDAAARKVRRSLDGTIDGIRVRLGRSHSGKEDD